MAQDFNIWEGVYGSFGDVPTGDSAFESERWLESQSAPFANLPGAQAGRPEASSFARTRDYVFPVVAAMMLDGRTKVRVLDFGGGVGSRLLEVLGSIPRPDGVDATVIDTAAICEKGRLYFKSLPGIRFTPNLPAPSERFDIVHCGSSLHYVEDWFGMIRRFCSYRPRYLLLSDVLVGDIPTFVTAQIYYGKRIPVWMWNRREFLERLESLGLRVIFDCAYIASIRGKAGPLPMENMPASHRLDHTRHLLLSHEVAVNLPDPAQ